MATLRVFQTIENDVWKVTFVNDPIHLSDTDKRLMKQFGEPEIQVGGTYTWDSPSAFTLPDKTVRIRSDFPFTQSFDALSDDFADDTQTKVEFYRTTIVTRFTTAMTTLRTTPDTFTGEKVYNI